MLLFQKPTVKCQTSTLYLVNNILISLVIRENEGFISSKKTDVNEATERDYEQHFVLCNPFF